MRINIVIKLSSIISIILLSLFLLIGLGMVLSHIDKFSDIEMNLNLPGFEFSLKGKLKE